MARFRLLFDLLPVPGSRCQVPSDQAHHLVHVRRVAHGDSIECIDRAGTICSASVEIGSEGVWVVAGPHRAASPSRMPDITLCAPLLPEHRFDWLLQKCTEIGVSACVPVATERCIMPRARAAGKLGRWRKICDEAARQCGGAPMRIEEPLDLAAALALAAPLRLVADIGDEPLGCRTADAGPLALLVGPEGGLSPAELDAAVAAGWQPVRFHPHTLRAETAAVVCCALLQFCVQ